MKKNYNHWLRGIIYIIFLSVYSLKDSYLQELQDQVQDLRAKVLEEKIITAQLEQIQCGLQGIAGTWYNN